MDQNQLERLIASLTNNEVEAYRTSGLTKAVEMLDIVEATNPELYEHLLNEAKRRAEKKALVKIPQLDYKMTYMPRVLRNSVQQQEENEGVGILTVAYVGEATSFYLLHDTTIRGRAILTKYKIGERNKKRKLWRIKTSLPFFGQVYTISRSGDDCSKYGDGDNGYSGYLYILLKRAKEERIFLPSGILDAVFDPINEKIGQLYDQIARGECSIPRLYKAP